MSPLPQSGPYNPDFPYLEAVKEPSPVKATIRGDEYKALILKEAEKAGVLEEAKINRDEIH